MIKIPSNPDMEALENRKQSFIGLSWDQNIPVKVKVSTEAGFYYRGFNDMVKCFHFSIPVCEWAEGNGPLIGHAKYSPKCIVLKLNHSEEFIKECRENYIKTIKCISDDNDSSDDMGSNFSDYMNSFDVDSD
jgi:hypothetical protein